MGMKRKKCIRILHLHQFPQQLRPRTKNMYKLCGCKKRKENILFKQNAHESQVNSNGSDYYEWDGGRGALLEMMKQLNRFRGLLLIFLLLFSRFHLSTEENYYYTYWVSNTYHGGSVWCAWIDRVFIQWCFDIMVWQTESEFQKEL